MYTMVFLTLPTGPRPRHKSSSFAAISTAASSSRKASSSIPHERARVTRSKMWPAQQSRLSIGSKLNSAASEAIQVSLLDALSALKKPMLS
jgi:hypothetical protein